MQRWRRLINALKELELASYQIFIEKTQKLHDKTFKPPLIFTDYNFNLSFNSGNKTKSLKKGNFRQDLFKRKSCMIFRFNYR